MSTENRKVQLETSVDASGAREGFNEVKDAAQSMAQGVQSSAAQAGKAVDSIGNGGSASAQKIDGATRSIINSIQRTTATMQAGEKDTSSYYEALAGQRGVNTDILRPFLDQLDDVAKKTKLAAESQRHLDESTRFLDGLKSKADSIGKTASQLAQMRAEELGVAEAAAPMIAKLRESEGAMSGTGAEAIKLATALGGVISAQKLMSSIKDVTISAGKYEQVGIVVNTLGQNAGYTAGELAKIQTQLEATGISMMESRQTIATMISANMDLANATTLARLAQDAAVIGQINSSEALNRLMHGVQSAQVEVLRGIGLNVSFEKSYADLAAQLKKNVNDLSEQEKMQARVNAVMGKASTIAGSYSASMESAAKQMGSLSRYADNASVSIGQAFQPAFSVVIKGIGESLKFTHENANLAAISLSAVAGGVVVLTGAVAALTLGTRAFAAAALMVSANPWILALTAIGTAIAGAVAWYGTWKAESNKTAQAIETDADRAIAAARRMASDIGQSVQSLTQDIKKFNDELDRKLGLGPSKIESLSARYAADAAKLQKLGSDYATAIAAGDLRAAGAIKNDLQALSSSMQSAYDDLSQAKSKYVTDYVGTQDRMTEVQKKQMALAKAEKEFSQAMLAASGDLQKSAAIRAAYNTEVANIHQSFGKKGAPESKARLGFDIEAIKKASEELVNTYANAEKVMESLRSAGLIGDREYYESKRGFIRLETEAKEQALQLEIARLQREKLAGKDRIDNEKKIVEAQSKLVTLRASTTAQLEVLNNQEAAAARRLESAYLSARQAAQDYFDTIQRQQDRDLASIGLGSRQRNFNAGISQIEERYAGQRRDLENQKAQLELEGRFTDEARQQYERRLAIIGEFQAKSIDSFTVYYNKLIEQQSNWALGAAEALQNYADDSKNVFAQVGDLVRNSFRGMEDALVKFTMSGKLNFRDFSNSIIEDINRMVIKSQITGPLANWVNDGIKSGGGSLLGALFGGGRALGGPVSAGKIYEVNERGPELLNVSGRQYLMMGNQSGSVDPDPKVGGSSMVVVNNHFTLSTPTDRRTQQQVAAAAGAGVQRAMARNG